MDKLAKVRHILESENLDALVILSDYNRRYISDFTGTSGALIISNNENKLITDFRYIEQATNQATHFEILNIAKVGMTERELKALLESKMLELGADGPSFDTIVASGYRGALPHGVASDKVVEKGDMITLDFGAYYRGYCSDITRTFAIGEPDKKLKEIYNIVLQSQIKAIEEIKPGMTTKEADALSRDYIEAHGYGNEFGHSLGHGIGLDIHEGPVLSKNTNDTVQVNNCVTIEPGIYVDGLGGVRIEDDILITENGCEVFTKCTKDLIIL